MSLLTRHTVKVQRRTVKHTAAGTAYQNSGAPIEVRGDFRYVSSDEMVNNGVAVQYVARFLVPGVWEYGCTPLLIHGKQTFEIEGLPLVRDGSPRTAHTQLNLRYAGDVA